ncbi:MAG TPA: tripartite tricarboxylate transporter substrate binding protein [Hyphomicrobiaceae bacterium]|nr:tripartite tricarboxylate transporter substrate binding protein [Hyphomicrobiaceae bacterium]
MTTVISTRFMTGCIAGALALLATCGWAAAQSFPSQTVKIVVPNPAGGTADALPRLIADALSAKWNQSVVVENRPGAAGNIAAEAFARAPADGYTLLASPPTTLAINQSLYKKINYDPTTFKPITILGTSPNVLIVNRKIGASSVKELIAKAKADPGGIPYGSQGIGATSHLTTALFETRAGIKLNHVPYKGTAPAMNDLVGGHILMMFDNLASSLPQHRSGTLNILAVCTPERSPYLPKVPTMAEAGLPGFVSVAWFGLVAPPGTPDDIADKISRDVVGVLKTDEIRKRFEAHATTPLGTTPKETAAYMERERKLWGEVIRKANLKRD